MTSEISSYLTDDHRRCDRLLAGCEAAVADKTWEAADEALSAVRDALLRHFTLEEEILFPEVEQADPAALGPTGVMRMEHVQMRQLLDDLAEAVRTRDSGSCLGGLETLHFLIQQHNTKEEGILYPLADGALSPGAGELVERMQGA